MARELLILKQFFLVLLLILLYFHLINLEGLLVESMIEIIRLSFRVLFPWFGQIRFVKVEVIDIRNVECVAQVWIRQKILRQVVLVILLHLAIGIFDFLGLIASLLFESFEVLLNG